MKRIVLVTGGFDPLHSGHIDYFKAAKKLGDELWVGLNSDEWLIRKKGQAFMPYNERLAIISNLNMVDNIAVCYGDAESNDACGAIHHVLSTTPMNTKVIFANGGDRKPGNVPEQDMYADDANIEFAWGVGGDNKKNSSSWILQEWKEPKTVRTWGYYRVLHQNGPGVKVKELTVEPGKRLSMQRHEERSEHWFVSEGTAHVYTLNVSSDAELRGIYTQHQSLHIPCNEWHQLANESDKPLKIVEIQYGINCVEEDIERL